MQRVRHPVGRHRRARGAECLGRDLAAVQRQARPGADFVLAPEQVAVELLQVEELREPAHGRIILGRLHTISRPVACRAARTIISACGVTAGERGSRVPPVERRTPVDPRHRLRECVGRGGVRRDRSRVRGRGRVPPVRRVPGRRAGVDRAPRDRTCPILRAPGAAELGRSAVRRGRAGVRDRDRRLERAPRLRARRDQPRRRGVRQRRPLDRGRTARCASSRTWDRSQASTC